MERRLAAVMATDVVGYTRLIRADEEGTLAALQGLRADLIDPTLAEHNGRIVKLMGDGMLAEFASVVDAVQAAVETQQAVTEHNADIPEEKRIEFRVGINLGDVVIDGDDTRSGSTAVLRLHHQEGPFLGEEQTKSRRKRKSPLECRMLGAERTSIRTSGTSLLSQIRTFKHPATNV